MNGQGTMTVLEALWMDGDKFMWDGAEYGSRSDAEAQAKTYADNGFQTKVIEDGEKFLVYTRRVVTQIVVDGNAPVG